MVFRGFNYKSKRSFKHYAYSSDNADSDRGGHDEYYVAYCSGCNEKTEHDVCTDNCVECGE